MLRVPEGVTAETVKLHISFAHHTNPRPDVLQGQIVVPIQLDDLYLWYFFQLRSYRVQLQ